MRYTQFGFHLTLDFYECPFEPLQNMDTCYKALNELPKILDMVTLTPPYLIKAGSNEDKGGKDPGGITGFVVIAESHVSMHTFARRGFISFDIYSCKEFDLEKAEIFLKNLFNPKEVEKHYLDRGKKYPAENIY